MSDRARLRLPVLGVALAALCWPLWVLVGAVEAWTGFDDLDVVLRVAAIFALLTLVEVASARLTRT